MNAIAKDVQAATQPPSLELISEVEQFFLDEKSRSLGLRQPGQVVEQRLHVGDRAEQPHQQTAG